MLFFTFLAYYNFLLEWTVVQLTAPNNPNDNFKTLAEYQSEIDSIYLSVFRNDYTDECGGLFTVNIPANVTKGKISYNTRYEPYLLNLLNTFITHSIVTLIVISDLKNNQYIPFRSGNGREYSVIWCTI